MAVATFDTLKFFEALKDGGIPERQAKAETAALSEARTVNFKELVTKDDLKSEALLLRTELKGDFQNAIQNAKYELLKWMVTAWVTLMGAIIGIRFLTK